uniref:Uncharacterized protein n=1 Tax=Aegilops tauschii subsp. strangulata TaxID=200361 RepID=A0A453ABH1_AEGTS
MCIHVKYNTLVRSTISSIKSNMLSSDTSTFTLHTFTIKM